ncbi:hypothetical protein SALBM311S_07463 [Streptomyces alboniger]
MPTQPKHLGSDTSEFVAVIFVGVVLIMSRSASVTDLTSLGGLYVAWISRPRRDQHRPSWSAGNRWWSAGLEMRGMR